MKRAVIVISGRVHGVFFRDFVKKKSLALRISGQVRNLDNGTVEVIAEGSEGSVNKLIEYCKKGPLLARVNNIKINFEKQKKEFNGFNIMH